jgi:hypothetical protein
MSIQNKMRVLAAVAMLVSGSATAATYNVWLKKTQGQAYQIDNQKCAVGTVDSVGAFNLTIEAFCFGDGQPAAQVTISGNGTLHTADIQTNANNEPVSSADGITFNDQNLVMTWGPKALAVGARVFTYTIPGAAQGDQATVIAGLYHLHNQAASIPEPETLALALIGLAGLALTRRKRK